MFTKLRNAPLLLVLIAAGMFSIMSVGGCPAPQQPQQPPAQEPNDGGTTPPPSTGTGDEGGDRPVGEPNIPTSSSDSGDNEFPGEGGDGGAGGGAGGEGSTAHILVSVNSPTDPVAVRPGAILAVTFSLIDTAGSAESAELLLARDDDNDGLPDVDSEGNTLAPVLTETISAVAAGDNATSFDTSHASGLLTDGFGRFVLGVRVNTVDGTATTAYSPATLTLDAVPPAAVWQSPQTDDLVNRDVTWTVQLQTTDNSPHTVRILLDPDTDPDNNNESELVPETSFDAGTGSRSFSVSLAAYPAGTYHYYAIVSDGIDPPTAFYAENPTTGSEARLSTTNRLIGDFDLDQLTNSPDGAILQGVNFNDLAGSSLSRLPDIDGDGVDEILLASRFGKPFIINDQGIGFGEAYMIYGGARLNGTITLNSVGRGNVEGLVFPGIRFKMNEIWSEGLADVTYVPDMDGDGLPELVFGFPRVESLSLADPAFSSAGTAFQHPELVADLPGMGNLEYSSIDGSGNWVNGVSQFARGGIVIVSSHNDILASHSLFNRKGDRVIDLHEVGQLFNGMSPPSLLMYARKIDPPEQKCQNCEPDEFDPNTGECTSGCGCGLTGNDQDPNETTVTYVTVAWDTYFTQGPGGFLQNWCLDSHGFLFQDPPLANARAFTASLPPDDTEPCDDACVVTHRWYGWVEEAMCMAGLPGTNQACNGAWAVPMGMSAAIAWTGFYGPNSTPIVTTSTGRSYVAPIGARVLGESVEDQFGTSVSADDTWLYIAAPERTATVQDVPALASDRTDSGVVYMYRVNTAAGAGQPTRSQLWIEPGTRTDPNDPNSLIARTWPYVDAELPNRTDYTMPVPHQYTIETVGSIRGRTFETTFDLSETSCTAALSSSVPDATNWYGYGGQYNTGTSGYYVDRTPQIVGPHDGAKISFVRALGDVNGDGINDFAVGSPNVKSDVVGGTGDTVGALFIVYGRSTGLEGDYLLERLALDPSDANRLHGVLLKGSSPDERLARVIDAVGDFNGDGFNDIIVGSERGGDSTEGEAIVIFGSPTLESPAGGWTTTDVAQTGRAVRFVGEAADSLAGANVAGTGDVDGDGLDDILIAAPGADGNQGAVYLIYGSATLSGVVELADVGTVDVPGARFLGRNFGDMVGGGFKSYTGTSPVNPAQEFTAYSAGVANLGDIDGDGLADFGISAILADPGDRTDAGEVYILYGRSGP